MNFTGLTYSTSTKACEMSFNRIILNKTIQHNTKKKNTNNYLNCLFLSNLLKPLDEHLSQQISMHQLQEHLKDSNTSILFNPNTTIMIMNLKQHHLLHERTSREVDIKYPIMKYKQTKKNAIRNAKNKK